jgi:hypothetical protein
VPRGWVRRSEGPRSRWGQVRPAGWVFAGEAPRGAWQHSTVVRVGRAMSSAHARRRTRVGQVALIVAIIKDTKVTVLGA